MGSGYDYLTVFLVEDNIPAQAQLDGWSDGYAENYIHRNTMRKVLTNVWGNKIVWKDGICALKFESEIDASWNAENLKAVAFIHRYDPASPVNCQVYTANSSILPQYGIEPDDSLFEETSSIDNVMQNAERFDVYTVMGVKVKADATDFEGLPRRHLHLQWQESFCEIIRFGNIDNSAAHRNLCAALLLIGAVIW